MEKKYNHSTLFLYLLIFVIPISCIQEEAPPQKVMEPIIKVKKDTISRHLNGFPVLFPINEAAQQPALEQTVDRLLSIVKKKNTDSLLNYIADDIQINFGGEGGLDAFKGFWKLSEQLENSKVWGVLEKILHLGGTFYHEDEFFVPYTFSRFPAEYNPNQFGAIVSERVIMRADTNISADSIATLTYEIVRVIERKDNWIKIKRQNEMTGYIGSQNISCPSDYRLGLKRVDGIWKISLLVK